MADRLQMIARIRNELGDFGKTFRHAVAGDGQTDRFDLPVSLVRDSDFKVFTLANSTITNLVRDIDYKMDFRNSVLTLTRPLPNGVTMIAEGMSYGLFSDEDLGEYLNHAILQHTHGATTEYRWRDANGFIRYAHAPVTLETLPELEEVLVGLLATQEALWTLSTDASTDIDVSTAEGTFVSRSQRYRQILNQIDLLKEKYKDLSQQLNVGLWRVEMSDLRRVSRTTGRLIPLYVAREFDDHNWDRQNFHHSERKLPMIDRGPTEEARQRRLHTNVGTHDILAYAGDDFALEIDIPMDLTGSVVRADIKTMTRTLVPFTITVVNAVEGQVRLSLTSAQTAALGPYATYDLQVTDDMGKVTTYLRGQIVLERQITV